MWQWAQECRCLLEIGLSSFGCIPRRGIAGSSLIPFYNERKYLNSQCFNLNYTSNLISIKCSIISFTTFSPPSTFVTDHQEVCFFFLRNLYFMSMMCVWVLSHLIRVWLFATPWTVAFQAPLSMGFSRRYTGVDCHLVSSGEERMAEREGWRGGERDKRRGEEKGVGRDPVWCRCRHWPSVNGKVTEPHGASAFSHLQWE